MVVIKQLSLLMYTQVSKLGQNGQDVQNVSPSNKILDGDQIESDGRGTRWKSLKARRFWLVGNYMSEVCMYFLTLCVSSYSPKAYLLA